MGSRKSVQDCVEDFVKDLIQEFNAGEDCMTDITFNPYLFEKLMESIIGKRGFGCYDHNQVRKAKEVQLNLQSGTLTVRKDVSKIIERKEKQIESLLKEIEELKK